MRKISSIMAAVVIIITCGGVMAVTFQTCTTANSATVHTPRGNITAYRDEACTKPLEDIDWGHIDEGKPYSKTFWVKNEGDDEVCAEWHDDIEEERDERDNSYMRYYIETTDRWLWWGEEYESKIIPLNSTGKYPISATNAYIPPPIPPTSGPRLKPGEKVKVRYTIEFKISYPTPTPTVVPMAKPTPTPAVPIAMKCKWDLTLGY